MSTTAHSPRPRRLRHLLPACVLVPALVALSALSLTRIHVGRVAATTAGPTTPPASTLPTPIPPVTSTLPQAPAAGLGTGQLLRSVNDGLFDAADQLMNNTGTQALLRQYGTPLIRMPFRDGLTDAQDVQALQAIKNSGAAPLVIVHGACVSDPYTPDNHLLSLVHQVFPTGPVYVEYGNEEDLACAGGSNGAQTYTTSWNNVVPQLKANYPTFKFIGPVNFQANPTYIATFVKGANPQPDFISWHEYVCNTSESDSYCLSHIGNWATHVSNTNAAVQSAIGHTIPIMITEWNLDPFADPRYSNPSFIQQWTTAALNEWSSLANQGVYAAFLYAGESHSIFQLIDSSNNLTPQGAAFFTSATSPFSASATLTGTAPPISSTAGSTLTNTTTPVSPTTNSTLVGTTPPVSSTTLVSPTANSTLVGTTAPTSSTIGSTAVGTTAPISSTAGSTLTNTTTPVSPSANSTLAGTTMPISPTTPVSPTASSTQAGATTPVSPTANTNPAGITTPIPPAAGSTSADTTAPVSPTASSSSADDGNQTDTTTSGPPAAGSTSADTTPSVPPTASASSADEDNQTDTTAPVSPTAGATSADTTAPVSPTANSTPAANDNPMDGDNHTDDQPQGDAQPGLGHKWPRPQGVGNH